MERIQNDIELLKTGTENIDLESQENKNEDIRCSLCNKSIEEVEKIICAHQFWICNECITRLYKIITE